MKYLSKLLELIFPSRCVSCKTSISYHQSICNNCLNKIPLHQTLFCGACDARLPHNKKICHPETPYMLGAATSYDKKAVQDLIWQLKFKHRPGAAIPLATLIENYLTALNPPVFPTPPLVVSIPLSPERLRERGYNQSALIAAHVAEHFGWPISHSLLRRTRHTAAQSHLKTKAERLHNVANCFEFVGEDIQNQTILLIDDVTTTGATLHEAAALLKHHGAKHLIATTAAKR